MTPLAKLLEAALFASAHPVRCRRPRAMVADDETSADDVTAALEEIRAALRRRRAWRRADGSRRRMADSHSPRIHRSHRARAACRSPAAALGCRHSRHWRSSRTGSQSDERRSRRFAVSARADAQVTARARADRSRRTRRRNGKAAACMARPVVPRAVRAATSR